MIGKGVSRSNATQLGDYLLKEHGAEAVRVLDVRGTIASDVKGAMEEMEAIAKATKCDKHLYHAVLSPQRGQSFTDAQKLYAVEILAKQLGLDHHARVVVEHEKQGEPHIHIAFSRINPDTLKAVRMSHDRVAIHTAARIIEHDLGHGFIFTGQHEHVIRRLHAQGRNDVAKWMEVERDKMLEQPILQRGATRDEEEQSRRLKVNLKQVRSDIGLAWEQSDNGAAFRRAIEDQGYVLARGNRRDYVVVDIEGGVHSVARCLSKDIKAAQVRERFADLGDLSVPNVEEAKALQAQHRHALEELQRDNPISLEAHDLERLAATLAERLTYHRAFFSEEELHKGIAEMQRQAADTGKNAEDLRRVFFATQGVEVLYERATGDATEYYTTQDVRRQEQDTLARAVSMAGEKSAAVDSGTVDTVAKERTLDAEQFEAVRYVTSGNGRLHILEGRAGTGKSHTLGAVRESFEREGCRVIGLAPTNAVVSDMQRDGFREARTVHSLLWHAEKGTADGKLARGDVLIVDEAAMMDTRTLHKFLTHADKSEARVILVGDDRQLASVERGGLFAEMKDSVGSAALTTVRRQKDDWARAASEDFAAGRFDEGLAAYEQHGCIHWQDTPANALSSLVESWKQDTQEQRGKQFVFAYTNKDVDALNTALQAVEIARGRVGELQPFVTSRGTVLIGEGDKVQFRGTDKRQGILNGVVGTMQHVTDEHCTVLTDAGQQVRFNRQEFSEIGLGYAGTIYKGQGKTLDHAYLLHSHHWRDQASYVAMTRATHGTQLFVDRETVDNTAALAAQMSRVSGGGSSLQFATHAELFDVRAAERVKALEATHKAQDALQEKRLEAQRQEREKEALAKLIPPMQEPPLGVTAKAQELLAKKLNPHFKTRDERQKEKDDKHRLQIEAVKKQMEREKNEKLAAYRKSMAQERAADKQRYEMQLAELKKRQPTAAAKEIVKIKVQERDNSIVKAHAAVAKHAPEKDLGRER